ncbi:alpha/beta fold hydrolase [Nocardia sp. KC 131]|uniref:alpha/beta fold hydrolase n=1 Tax=Nocardia arseniciresistens TaxID=3392119 RepID=UPI00398EF0E8
MAKKAQRVELDVTEGTLEHGLPYLALGSGRPLVFLRWFTPDHANPRGWLRDSEIRTLTPLAARRRVYAVNRAPGMAEGTTMADIAAQHAKALRAEFGGPVDVLGVSSGGSLALQLAVDHPEAVRRLVIASSGYRLEDHAREAQLRYAIAAADGQRALHHMAPVAASSPILGRLTVAAMWLIDPLARPKNPADALAFILAEDAFDLTGRLAEISAPTLVIGGDRDSAYGTATFRHTADGIPNSRLIIYPGTGHMGAIKHPRFASDIAAFLDAA